MAWGPPPKDNATDRRNVGLTHPGLALGFNALAFTVAHGDTCCSFCLAQKEAKAWKHYGESPRSLSW